MPQSLDPHLGLDYINLVYACRRCNLVKLDRRVDDPFVLLTSETVAVAPDGSLVCMQPKAKRLVRQLDLNSPKLKKWRVMWMRIVDLAQERDANLHQQLVGFPDDLPNLGRLKPPANSRPEGIAMSFHAKRQRGELSQNY